MVVTCGDAGLSLASRIRLALRDGQPQRAAWRKDDGIARFHDASPAATAGAGAGLKLLLPPR